LQQQLQQQLQQVQHEPTAMQGQAARAKRKQVLEERRAGASTESSGKRQHVAEQVWLPAGVGTSSNTSSSSTSTRRGGVGTAKVCSGCHRKVKNHYDAHKQLIKVGPQCNMSNKCPGTAGAWKCSKPSCPCYESNEQLVEQYYAG
jgi:hypothetical protein